MLIAPVIRWRPGKTAEAATDATATQTHLHA